MNLEYVKYILPMRRRFQAMGRTVNNQPRRNRARPQLWGLDTREYHRRYMQIWRGKAA